MVGTSMYISSTITITIDSMIIYSTTTTTTTTTIMFIISLGLGAPQLRPHSVEAALIEMLKLLCYDNTNN